MNISSFNKFASTFLAVTSILLLSSCINLGGTQSATTSSTDERIKTYDTSEFTISVPKEWEIIDKKQFTDEVPPETIVVFRNNVKNETFTANLAVIKNNLQGPVDTLEYAKMVLNRQKSGLFDYKESTRDEYKVSIGGKDTATYFSTFEAKKTANDKLVKYIQTYAVKDNAAYIITGAVSTKENDSVIKTIEDMVKSFKLK